MNDLELARTLRAAGRQVEGLTLLVGEVPLCVPCRAARRSTDALVAVLQAESTADVPMCSDHFAALRVPVGPAHARVLIPTGPALAIDVPPGTEPAGYARLIRDLHLCALPPDHVTFIAARGGKRTVVRDGQSLVILPASYRPKPALLDHLEFALKYDGVNLQVLDAVFRRVAPEGLESGLAQRVRDRPTGVYVRRLWFLYEFLTGRVVPVEDASTGNYVPLLDPAIYYTASGVRSRRHRVVDNLLGNADFCPLVRRTERLAAFEAENLGAEASRIVADFDEDTIRRAVSVLYTKETRSSFDIEGERPSASRTEQFVSLLRTVPTVAQLTMDELLTLQNATVDPRYADRGYRSDQVYVGEQVDLARQKIHFIAARPEDVPRLMDGFLEAMSRVDGWGVDRQASGPSASVDPVVLAAALSFGFVFIHPFQDGNGRLHRLLIHYVLARMGFTPKGLIFPVSAVMVARKHEYDETLEAFSVPLMRVVDYDEDADGVVAVKNETAHLYRFFDATAMAEALYGWVQETVRTDLRRELEFVVAFRDLRRDIVSIVDLPDRKANLLIKLCLQNNGHLAPAKRRSHFEELTDAEVAAVESAIRGRLDTLRRPQAGAQDAEGA
ncbi:MAG: Fic family protein [Bradymonadia bacterium]